MCKITHELPPLCTTCRALLPPPVSGDFVAISECPNCHQKHASFLPGWLPTDEETIKHFGDNVQVLMDEFGHSFSSAVGLARDYYNKFTDQAYCHSIGIPTQDDDFFWHEGLGMAARIHYYLGMSGDPDPHRFIDWRAERNRLTASK